jgi:hypothetical protein
MSEITKLSLPGIYKNKEAIIGKRKRKISYMSCCVHVSFRKFIPNDCPAVFVRCKNVVILENEVFSPKSFFICPCMSFRQKAELAGHEYRIFLDPKHVKLRTKARRDQAIQIHLRITHFCGVHINLWKSSFGENIIGNSQFV